MTEQVFFVAVISAIVSAALVAIGTKMLARRKRNILDQKLVAQTERVNELERTLHLKEMDFLAERNKIGLAHSGELQEARERAFEDGRSRAKAEHAHELVMRTEALHNEFTARLHEDKEKAAEEARERLRAEYEIQTKLFSVKISPYVQLLTDNGLFKNTHEAKVGYQYQLLVNGIPAFQPHVFIERHEKIEKVDEQTKDSVLQMAKACAEVAISTYLGGSPQFARLSKEVLVEQGNK